MITVVRHQHRKGATYEIHGLTLNEITKIEFACRSLKGTFTEVEEILIHSALALLNAGHAYAVAHHATLTGQATRAQVSLLQEKRLEAIGWLRDRQLTQGGRLYWHNRYLSEQGVSQ